MPRASDYGKKCGAKLRPPREGTCSQPAGYGTPHLGIGRCKFHGGASPNGIKAAAKEMSMAAAMETGIETDSETFLDTSLDLVAGEVHFCLERMARIRRHDEQFDATPRKPYWMWNNIKNEALDRGVKFAHMTLSAGFEERRIQVAEIYGRLMALKIEAICESLQLTNAQQKQLPKILEAELSSFRDLGNEEIVGG